jgi:2-haloacid dehalogenase
METRSRPASEILGSSLPGAARFAPSVKEPAALATFVFDAYGTLFDVNAAIARHREAAGPHAYRLSEIWRTKQLEYTWTLTLAGRYVDFWTLTERALDHALARVPSVAPALKSPLLDAYLRLDAFADAAATLAELKRRGHRTAILSNGSPPMLDAAVAAAGIGSALDAVLSVESVGVYKPDPRVYTLVTATFTVAPAAVTFVSSNRWDVMGAATFGFRAVWINRQGAPDEYAEAAPVSALSDLGGLLEMAGAAPP